MTKILIRPPGWTFSSRNWTLVPPSRNFPTLITETLYDKIGRRCKRMAQTLAFIANPPSEPDTTASLVRAD